MSASRANPRKPDGAKRRGSVLVFTVLLLVLLAGIGTAFIMFVNLEYAASGNALRNTQSRAAAETGLAHAQYMIRESFLQDRFETPDGHFFYDDVTPTTRLYLDETQGLFRFFEYHDTIDTVSGANSALTGGNWSLRKDFAWLYWKEDDPSDSGDDAYCGTAELDTAHSEKETQERRYTQTPLSHFAYPNGEIRKDRFNGIEHAGLARRFVVYNPVMDFYPDASKAVSPYRGEYYIWLADLDGKLAAPHSGETWGITNPGDVEAILRRLSSYSYTASGWVFDDTGMYKLGMTDTEITALATRPGSYSSIEDIAVYLNRTPLAKDAPTSDKWSRLYYRFGLERYLTCWPDNGNAVKVHESALNVNTASYEVLTAVLSRIPLVDGVDPNVDPLNLTLTKASYLAKRICAKRPFICRIDFEDFLAAHLNADPTGTTVDDPEDGTTIPQTPVRMLYLAIPKREYTDAKDTSLPQKVLTLSQLMEAPVSDTDARYTWLRSGLGQRARFLWFRSDDTAAPLVYTDPDSGLTYTAFLSVKAFNNILNSISGQQPGGPYGYSFYSYDGVLAPFKVDVGGTQMPPKFEYNELTQTVIDGGTNIYTLEGLDPVVHTEGGELAAWRLTKTSGYYEMVFKISDDTQIYEYGLLIPITRPVPPVPVPVISGGLNGAMETPALPDETENTSSIDDPSTGDFVCDSTIHAPLRAYRHDHTSEPDVTDAKPAVNAGDISWSPRFCFRSRFFKVYVLARSIATLKGDGTPVYGPTSRLEAVYDAVDDKILWRRWQATELRRISDPVP